MRYDQKIERVVNWREKSRRVELTSKIDRWEEKEMCLDVKSVATAENSLLTSGGQKVTKEGCPKERRKVHDWEPATGNTFLAEGEKSTPSQ